MTTSSPRRGVSSPLSADEPPLLRIGTWNMSHWTVPKVSLVTSRMAMDILAIQETHLAPIPLTTAHRTSFILGYIFITAAPSHLWPTLNIVDPVEWDFSAKLAYPCYQPSLAVLHGVAWLQ